MKSAKKLVKYNKKIKKYSDDDNYDKTKINKYSNLIKKAKHNTFSRIEVKKCKRWKRVCSLGQCSKYGCYGHIIQSVKHLDKEVYDLDRAVTCPDCGKDTITVIFCGGKNCREKRINVQDDSSDAH